MRDKLGAPEIVDRNIYEAELDILRVRQEPDTREERTSDRAFLGVSALLFVSGAALRIFWNGLCR